MRLAPAVLAIALLGTPAHALSCRDHAKEVQAAIKRHVEALRMIERETADRVAGLDTRPYDYLVAQVRAAAALVDDKNGLAAEAELERCRNAVTPVWHTCAAAARALVTVIEEQAKGQASKASKEVYAGVMPRCERYMGLAPLNTVLRTVG